jgi:tripartite-type tricarboxylate transporter receptor subunit TctC
MLNVPYKGAMEPLTDLLSGRIDVLIQTATFVFPQVKAGKLRPIALSSNARYPLMPEVATVAETLPGLAFSSWLGLVVAPKTPRAIIDRLNTEMRAILAEDEIRQRFAGLGGVPAHSSPEAMRAQIEREIARWKQIVDARGLERQ